MDVLHQMGKYPKYANSTTLGMANGSPIIMTDILINAGWATCCHVNLANNGGATALGYTLQQRVAC